MSLGAQGQNNNNNDNDNDNDDNNSVQPRILSRKEGHMGSSSVPLYIADAFTTKPFQGNSAAVCFLEGESWPATNVELQKVAREMNLSETAFLVKDRTMKNGFHLRWFTPTVEVNLCGHATLATAHVLFQEEHRRLDDGQETQRITFHTLSGDLIVERQAGKLVMDFPQGKPVSVKLSSETATQLLAALNIEVEEPLSPETTFVDVWHCATTRKLVVEVPSTKHVAALRPRFDRLTSIDFSSLDVRGVIVTTNTSQDSSNPHDFVSRYFAPWAGIPEDPVTGSAHTVLAVYWSQKLDSRTRFSAFQASARGGELSLELTPEGRVLIGGSAVTVLRGSLLATLE